MTLQTEIEASATSHRVGWYVVFDGIETRLATHDPDDGNTYLAGMEFPRASAQTLDRRQGVVRPGGFNITAPDPTGGIAALFARRGATEVPLSAGLDASSTTVQVVAGDFANGATVYLDRETITLGTYTASPSPRYTGCTRGAHGSQATEHQTGSTISSKPRHWDGRRAVLYEFNRDTGTAAAVRAGVVDGSPAWNKEAFDVDFLDLTTLLNRPIVAGWEEVDVVGMSFDSLTVDFKVDDASSFVVSNYGWAVVTLDDVRYFYKVESVDTVSTPNVVTCYDEDWGRERVTPSQRFRTTATIKTIVVAQEDPALFALHLMCSRYGDSGNTYDVLPGVAVDDGDGLTPERRMGAGLPEAWVDVDSWTDAIGDAGSLPTFVLDEPMHLLDFLFREIVWRMGGFIYQTADGKLAFRRYDPATADSSLAVYDESDLASTDITVVDDEREVLSGAVVESNWDYDRREYMHKSVINFAETQSVYGDNRDRLHITSRSLRVGAVSSHPHASHPVQESDLQAQFLRAYARTRLGLQRVRVAFRWQYHLRFFVGHRFKLTLASVPDGAGGVGITEQVFEVVHLEPETDTGRVVVECEAAVIAKLIGPRMEISAISSNTLTLNGDSTLQPEPSTLKQFPDGCSVRIFDASASPPFSTSEVEVVDGAQTTQGEIDLVALPSSFTVAVGDHVQMVFGGGNTGNTNDIGADVEDHAMMTDADGNVDGDTDHSHKWQ